MAKTLKHHLHHIRQRPEHVRERIALGAAGGFTALVAVGWMVALTTSGTLSLRTDTQAADATATEIQQTLAAQKDNFSNLLGAAGASFGLSNQPANMTIIDTSPTTTAPTNAASATVIPF